MPARLRLCLRGLEAGAIVVEGAGGQLEVVMAVPTARMGQTDETGVGMVLLHPGGREAVWIWRTSIYLVLLRRKLITDM